MKTSHLVGLASSLGAVVVATYLFVTWHESGGTSVGNNEQAIATTDTSAFQVGDSDELEDLRHDVQRLKSIVASLRADASGQGLRKEVESLRDQIASMEQELSAAPTSALASIPAEERGDGPAPLVSTEEDVLLATEDQAFQDESRREQIALEFHNETEDSQWSQEVTGSISGFFGEASDVATELRDVECRSTMCRIEAEFGSAAALEEFNLGFLLHVAEELPQATYEHSEREDGTIVVRAYMARQGHELPGEGATW